MYKVWCWQDDPQRGNNRSHTTLRQHVDQFIDAGWSFVHSLRAKNCYCHTPETVLWNSPDQMPYTPAGVISVGETPQHQQVTSKWYRWQLQRLLVRGSRVKHRTRSGRR